MTTAETDSPGLAEAEGIEKFATLGRARGTNANGTVKMRTPSLCRSWEGAELLRDVRRFLKAYVVLTREERIVLALWIIHTHAFDAAETTPYLSITSPVARSGKTTLLEVLELLVARPLLITSATQAI